MIMTVLGLALVAMLTAVAVTAVQGDSHVSYRDFTRKQAYEAAKAGIDEYAFHLHEDTAYWAKCADVAKPTALNQEGSTANRRTVPGSTTASYALELIPATGYTSCDSSSVAAATASMLESQGTMKGTFRVKSTGYAGDSEVSITATFKPASFLDYVYFTQLETSDPVTYGDEADDQRRLRTVLEDDRRRPLRRLHPELGLPEVRRDLLRQRRQHQGPDAHQRRLRDLQQPDPRSQRQRPGRGQLAAAKAGIRPGNSRATTAPATPTSPAPSRPTRRRCCRPRPTRSISTLTEPQFKFQGQVGICLEGSSMTVRSGAHSCSGGTVLYSGAQPANGIVYVENVACDGSYSPFETQYPETSECGNVFVHGTYTEPLTIAGGNDIIVDGNIIQEGEEGVLGLIANNFIRVYHPTEQYVWYDYQHHKHSECRNASGVLSNPEIDAAILAINHSFIVDSYNCGNQLGTLKVYGAIAQKYRGAVGTSGGTGYYKNYEYDERLHTVSPPAFIEPVSSDWVIGRETVG